jgi:hypothetical protein
VVLKGQASTFQGQVMSKEMSRAGHNFDFQIPSSVLLFSFRGIRAPTFRIPSSVTPSSPFAGFAPHHYWRREVSQQSMASSVGCCFFFLHTLTLMTVNGRE